MGSLEDLRRQFQEEDAAVAPPPDKSALFRRARRNIRLSERDVAELRLTADPGTQLPGPIGEVNGSLSPDVGGRLQTASVSISHKV